MGNDACNLENHLGKFIGKTVTICTAGGGRCSSFTGVLLCANCGYVRLVTRIGAAPDCLPKNNCMDPCTSQDSYTDVIESSNNSGNNTTNNSGCIVDIPICAITSFIHNSI